jgi:transcription antitermination factor NusG
MTNTPNAPYTPGDQVIAIAGPYTGFTGRIIAVRPVLQVEVAADGIRWFGTLVTTTDQIQHDLNPDTSRPKRRPAR